MLNSANWRDLRSSRCEQAIASREFQRALSLLDAAEPVLRPSERHSFPWSYLRQSIRDRLEVLSGQEAAIRCLAVSPDGQTLASADDQGSIGLWDLENWCLTVAYTTLKTPDSAVGIQPGQWNARVG